MGYFISTQAHPEVSIVMWLPQARWMVYFMENTNLKMDDGWRYPFSRKPPAIIHFLTSFI